MKTQPHQPALRRLMNSSFGLALWLAIAAPAFSQTANFDVGRDFSAANNPNGVWAFGWAGTVTGAVHYLTTQHVSGGDNGAQIPSWQLTSDEAPVVYGNTSGQAASVGHGLAQVSPNEVWFAGGQDGRPENFAVIQFIAPSNGQYVVVTAVRPFYNGAPQGDVDFHVVLNNTELFGQFLSPVQSTAYSNSVTLNAGDTIKFLLGHGADGLEYGSVYRIAALINPGANPIITINPPPPVTNPPPAIAYQYDAGRDFSALNNPSGAWTYGWTPTVGGPLTPLTVKRTSPTESGVSVPSWQLTWDQAPVVYCNTSSQTAVFGGGAAHMPPGAMWFSPGQDGRPENFTVLQFTAPAGSNYLIEAAVQPVYPGWPQGDTDFHVVQNNTELFSCFLAPSQSATFSNIVALGAGGTIQFAVGRGRDGSEYGSSLRIAVVITPTDGATVIITNPPPTAPVIVTQPLPYISTVVGGSVQLSVVASGAGPLSYQWLFNETPLAGVDADTATLQLGNIQPANGGSYRAVVSSPFGSVTSIVAVVNVATNPAGGGLVLFANGSTNRIYDVDGTNYVTTGGTLVVGLFVGESAEDLLQIGATAGFFPVPGRFSGGTRSIPGTTPGQTLWARVKVWDHTAGNTYEEAVAAGGKSGISSLFHVTLAGGILPPSPLYGMPSFGLTLPGVAASTLAASALVTPAPVTLRRLLRTQSGWKLTLTGPVGATCAIESSSNLTTWITVAYVVNDLGTVDYKDNNASAGALFFRVRLVNP